MLLTGKSFLSSTLLLLGARYFRRHEAKSVDLLCVIIESFDYLAHLEVPNHHCGVFARTGDKLIALTDVHIDNVLTVTVETSLQAQRVSVPNLEDPAHCNKDLD